MKKPKPLPPLTVRCPHCKGVNEPNYSELTKGYTCPVCTTPVDAQVFIEKRKRGG